MNYTIPLPEALQLAARRRAERYASVQAELDELSAVGCAVHINAAQLILLEEANLLYDFESELVEDFSIAPDNPARRIYFMAIDRQRLYQQVAPAEPTASADLLAELTSEMTATL